VPVVPGEGGKANSNKKSGPESHTVKGEWEWSFVRGPASVGEDNLPHGRAGEKGRTTEIERDFSLRACGASSRRMAEESEQSNSG